MPTPTGMLKAGDKIQGPDSVPCVVMQRRGNDINYAVKMQRVDGLRFRCGKHEVFLLEAGWWLKHGWKII